MNQAVEDYLAGLFTPTTLVPAPEVSTGTSAEIRTPESHAILVLADSIENIVGPLHRATIKILVSSDFRQEPGKKCDLIHALGHAGPDPSVAHHAKTPQPIRYGSR